MNKWVRKFMALTLILTLVSAQSMPTYASVFGDGWNAVKNGGESIVNGIVGEIEDVLDDVLDTIDDTLDSIGDIAVDVADTVADAGEDAIDTLGDLGDDALDSLEDIGDDALDTLDDLSDDALDGLETIGSAAVDGVEFVGGAYVSLAVGAYKLAKSGIEAIQSIDDLDFSSVKHDALKGLPILLLTDSDMHDVFTDDFGSLTELENVQTRVLNATTYTRIKDALDDLGIPSHIVDFVMKRVVGIDGDDIGGRIAELMPLNALYGDLVAGVINDLVNNEDYRTLDLYSEAIKPVDDLTGFEVMYQIPADKIAQIGQNLHIVVAGMDFGQRDDFKVNILKEKQDGQFETFETNPRALNGTELAFEAMIPSAAAGASNIYVQIVNTFDAPADASEEIASTIKSGLNAVLKECTSITISNQARRDIAGYLKEAGINDITENGDVGRIVADKLVSQIPVLGTLIQVTGLNDEMAKAIRVLIQQAEVRSYAKLGDLHIYAKGFGTSEEMAAAVDSATSAAPAGEGSIYNDRYDFSDERVWVDTDGGGWNKKGELSCSTQNYANAVIDGKTYANFVAQTDMRLEKGGNAGLTFRLSDINGTDNDFKGYMAGIGFDSNNKGRVFLGRMNHNFTELKHEAYNIVAGQTYTMRVAATGPVFEIYLDDILVLKTSDSAFTSGFMGYQVAEADAAFDNLTIAEYLLDDTYRYDFAYDLPELEYLSGNWELTEHDATTQLRAVSKKKSNDYALMIEDTYTNMLMNADITPTKDDGDSGILFRVTDYEEGMPNDGYYLGFNADEDGSGRVSLFAITSGGKMEHLLSQTATFTEDKSNDVTLKTVGNQIAVMVGGEIVMNVTDDRYTEGFSGFASRNSATYFDNVNIINLGDIPVDAVASETDAYIQSRLEGIRANRINDETDSVSASQSFDTLTLRVTTGTVKNADSDADIFAIVKYKDGTDGTFKLGLEDYDDYEKGETTKYEIELDDGKMYSDVYGVYIVNTGSDGWFPTYVKGSDPSGNTVFSKYVGQWLDTDTDTVFVEVSQNGDHVAEDIKEISESGDFATMTLKIKTGTRDNADSDSDMFVYFKYFDGTSTERELDIANYNDFEKGHTDSYEVSLAAGKTYADVSGIWIGTKGSDGWYPERVRAYDPFDNILIDKTLNVWLDMDDNHIWESIK